ncbi:hypothetical protein DLAC_10915 [Tieghemostelium lacteum]|uniref:Uncharacterized protein n=1 Tax=Tieghemostelium lacteum TaxID=361077 RepID=A0A151Z2Q5_TIELA|nr:hypothetical protein DLAC_10915 [Tieghemostelium lacteum]|eukprot:KYQ88231.1 hypothetical protein DLAC_10915 [Tieghemostelium lacteum]
MSSQIINLDYILGKLEDLLTENDFKDGNGFTRIRKRKNDREEKSFISRISTSMKQLIEYKGERTMVHIFHLRFIHTNQHTKRARVQKIITTIKEYIRLLNKSVSDQENNYHQYLLSTPSVSNLSSTTSTPQLQSTNIISNNSNNIQNQTTPPTMSLAGNHSPITTLNTNNSNNNSNNTPPNNNSPGNSFLNNVDSNCNINESYESNNVENSNSISNSSSSSNILTYNIGSSLTYVPIYNSNNIYSSNNTPSFSDDMEYNQNISILNTSSTGNFTTTSNTSSSSGSTSSGISGALHTLLNSSSQKQNDCSKEMKIAKELLDYLTSHQVDPDNSLVGCELNSQFLDGIFKLRSQQSFNKRSLIKMIKSWGSMKDDLLVKEVRKMSSTLNSIDFKKGELVIIDMSLPHNSNSNNNNHNGTSIYDDNTNTMEDHSSNTTAQDTMDQDHIFDFDFENYISNNNNNNNNNNHSNHDDSIDLFGKNNNYIFARFEEEFNRTCKCYNIPSEDLQTVLHCNINNVYKISPEILDFIKSDKSIIKLVNDPSVPFCHMLSFKERLIFNDYIQNQFGIDSRILEKCKNNSFSVIDMPLLKGYITLLNDLERNLTNTPLWTEILALSHKESKPFLENVRKTCMYIPLYLQLEEFVKTIEINREKQLKSRIKQNIISFDHAFHKIHMERKDFIEGAAKNRLSQGYLQLIRENVDSFLLKYGYIHNAVQTDYLERPPTNPGQIRSNLDILHSILSQDPQETIQQKEFKKLIAKLTDTIYPMIEEFILKSKLIILDSLDLFNSKYQVLEERGHLDMDFIRSIINHKKDSIEKQKLAHFERMLKDIEYLLDMKKKEGAVVEKRLEIVTISGLVFGKIHRAENEARTTLEVWGHLLAPLQNPNSGSHLPPHKPLPSLPKHQQQPITTTQYTSPTLSSSTSVNITQQQNIFTPLSVSSSNIINTNTPVTVQQPMAIKPQQAPIVPNRISPINSNINTSATTTTTTTTNPPNQPNNNQLKPSWSFSSDPNKSQNPSSSNVTPVGGSRFLPSQRLKPAPVISNTTPTVTTANSNGFVNNTNRPISPPPLTTSQQPSKTTTPSNTTSPTYTSPIIKPLSPTQLYKPPPLKTQLSDSKLPIPNQNTPPVLTNKSMSSLSLSQSMDSHTIKP